MTLKDHWGGEGFEFKIPVSTNKLNTLIMFDQILVFVGNSPLMSGQTVIRNVPSRPCRALM